MRSDTAVTPSSAQSAAPDTTPDNRSARRSTPPPHPPQPGGNADTAPDATTGPNLNRQLQLGVQLLRALSEAAQRADEHRRALEQQHDALNQARRDAERAQRDLELTRARITADAADAEVRLRELEQQIARRITDAADPDTLRDLHRSIVEQINSAGRAATDAFADATDDALARAAGLVEHINAAEQHFALTALRNAIAPPAPPAPPAPAEPPATTPSLSDAPPPSQSAPPAPDVEHTGRHNGRDPRRAHNRLRVELVDSNLGPILDLSRGGARIFTRKPRTGRIALTLTTHDDTLTVDADAIWSRKLGWRRYELGVQFVDLSPDDAERLTTICLNASVRRTLHAHPTQPPPARD